MDQSHQQIKYRAEDRSGYVLRPLGAMTLLYHRRSGQTHMIADPVPAIIEIMAGREASSAGEVAAGLAARFRLEAPGAAEPILAERLAELAALGIVEAV